MTKSELISIIREFIESCLKITTSKTLKVNDVLKTGAKIFENQSRGYYETFNVRLSNKNRYDTIYKVPWVVFLKQPNTPEQGIYPLILANVKDSMNGNGKLQIDICNGISKKNIPNKMWDRNVLIKPKTLYAELFPDCRIHKSFYFKDLTEFDNAKDSLLEALDEVIQEFNDTWR